MLISDFKHGLFKYEVKDYYAILGAPIFATPKEVRTRYLKLAYQLHPDTNLGDDQHKSQAAMMLAKVLNPAYENLYKPKHRRECELIFSDIASRLAPEINEINFNSEIAQQLLSEDDRKLLLKYEQTINKIAQNQYNDFNKVKFKVGLLSELNLIYLVRQKQQELAKASGKTYSSAPIMSSAGNINKNTRNINKTANRNSNVEKSVKADQDNSSGSRNNVSSEEKSSLSRLDKLLMSAKSFMENRNYEPAIVDLKEALKLDGNNAVAHALLGVSYLEQNNTTYGRIHIKKAASLDSKNIEVINAKEKLKGIDGQETIGTKGKKGKKGKSDKKGKDSKGKKEPPKIFGIPLW